MCANEPSQANIAQAFLVCDQIIEDKSTGKKSVIGIFTHVFSAAFPCLQPQVGIYFCITDADGSYMFDLELVYLDTNHVVGKAVTPAFEIKDRLQITDFGMMLSPVLFPGPGRYEFRLRVNSEFLGNKDLIVELLRPQQGS